MSTFDGFIREFNGLIRVDNFETKWVPSGCRRTSQVYLLSHAHSDHMVGLEKFEGLIRCSDVTAEIVRKIRTVGSRRDRATGTNRGINDRKYKNLSFPTNLLKPIPLNQPEIITLPTSEADQCRITPLCANHCPGSVMFLIQMWNKNVLYTGDIRAEPWWVESLTKESILADYVVPPLGDAAFGSAEIPALEPTTQLDNIYLDTSSLLTKLEVLTKEEAINITIEMMLVYPKDTNFFINAWTWGYEELLEKIATRFETSIHVDEYKYEIFSQPEFTVKFPKLFKSLTKNPTDTRFHACERNWRCPEVSDGTTETIALEGTDIKNQTSKVGIQKRLIVTVNPWEITKPRWIAYKGYIDNLLAEACLSLESLDPWPPMLICPLTRHSSFCEIWNFISAFRPKKIFPNTTHARTGFIEFYAIPKLFGALLPPDADRKMKKEGRKFVQNYEDREEQKPNKKKIKLGAFEWKGQHRKDVEEVFSYFEKQEFQSEQYRSMWNEFFQASNPKHKQEAARFIEGSSTTGTRSSTPTATEVITIDSSSDDGLDDSSCARSCTSEPSSMPEIDDELDEEKKVKTESSLSQGLPDIMEIDRLENLASHTSKPAIKSLDAKVNKDAAMCVTPGMSFKLESSETPQASSPGPQTEYQSLSYYSALLQKFEFELEKYVLKLSNQLVDYVHDPTLDQSHVGVDVSMSTKQGSRHVRKQWRKVRSSIVDVVVCRAEIIEVRRIAMARLLL